MESKLLWAAALAVVSGEVILIVLFGLDVDVLVETVLPWTAASALCIVADVFIFRGFRRIIRGDGARSAGAFVSAPVSAFAGTVTYFAVWTVTDHLQYPNGHLGPGGPNSDGNIYLALLLAGLTGLIGLVFGAGLGQSTGRS